MRMTAVRTVTDELIEQLDERSIAAWYCDDGNFSGHYARWGQRQGGDLQYVA